MSCEKIKETICKWSHTPKVERLFIVLTIYVASVDFYADWRFYLDIVSLRPGLVYGSITNDIVIPLFSFTVVGSVLYFFELLFLLCYLCGRKIDVVNFDTFMIVLTWCDTIPHLVINSVIASCHEYAISYIQLARAILSVALFFLRLIVTVIGYCREDTGKLDEEYNGVRLCSLKKKTFYHILNILGFIFQITLSLLIFQFTFIQTFNGYMQFHLPKDVIGGHIRPGRYFKQVNIYMSTSVIDEDYSRGWMNFGSLYHVIYSQRYGMSCDIRLSMYQEIDNSRRNRLIHFNKQFVNLQGQDMTENQCWLWKKNVHILTNQNCTKVSNRFVISKSFIFHIKYIPPNEQSQFGRIVYESFQARYPGKYVEYKVPLMYFVAEDGGFMLEFLSVSFNDTKRFYKMAKDLHSVKSIWKTGYRQCETNAPLHPLYVVGKRIF